jgi:PAS domain S-box-containing protein
MTVSFQGFRSLIENNPDPISLVDAAGKTVYGNASTTKLFGYLPEELVGRNFLELIHSEDRDRSSRMLREVMANPSDSLQWDARICGKDGSCSWVESTVFNLLFDPEVSAIVVQQRNVNVRRASEVKRKQKAEELARSNLRLEEFAYTAAHDLREPLRAISLYTQMLIHDVPMDANAELKAQFVVDGATRMSALVDDLLAFANTGAQQALQSVDLGHAAAEAIRNVTSSIYAARAVVKIDRLPLVMGNEIHLVRLLQNLMSNAVKYRAQEPVKIHVSASRRALDWIVRIEDNGPGIPPEHQARVFHPFVRLANRDIPGTGLGLAVCKKIVEGLGGSIWVESKVGEGSAFCFTVGAAEQNIPAPASRAASA